MMMLLLLLLWCVQRLVRSMDVRVNARMHVMYTRCCRVAAGLLPACMHSRTPFQTNDALKMPLKCVGLLQICSHEGDRRITINMIHRMWHAKKPLSCPFTGELRSL